MAKPKSLHTRRPAEEPSGPARPALKAISEDKDKIVEAMLIQARKGSYLHAKYLFELAGITTADDAGMAAHQQSLAQYLIEQLQLEPPPGAGKIAD